MEENTRDHGKWPAIIVGLLLLIAGLALAIGGGKLLSLGGSAYYLLAGVSIIACGVLFALRRGAALWLYALTLLPPWYGHCGKLGLIGGS